jgi:hypothetical protein
MTQTRCARAGCTFERCEKMARPREQHALHVARATRNSGAIRTSRRDRSAAACVSRAMRRRVTRERIRPGALPVSMECAILRRSPSEEAPWRSSATPLVSHLATSRHSNGSTADESPPIASPPPNSLATWSMPPSRHRDRSACWSIARARSSPSSWAMPRS